MNLKLSTIAATVGMFLAGATTGFSQLALNITNPSFESPASGSQQIFIAGTGATSTFVTGWTCATTAGYWDLNLPGSGGGITNVAGTQVLESYNIGSGVAGVVYQELTNKWVAGATYTMTARAGQPTGGNPPHTLDSVSIDTKNGSTLTQLSSATLSSAQPGLFNYKVTYKATGTEAGDGFPVVAYHVPSGNGTGGMWVDAFTITQDPAISVAPVSAAVVVAGNNTSFSATATGATTVSYQWQATNNATGWTNVPNTAPFSGATTATLSITSAQAAQALKYQLIVSDTAGTITSSVVTLTVSDPVISSQPTSQTAWVGSSASFSVTAAGGTTLSYQWQATNNSTGFTNIAGATSSTLNFPSVTTNNALNYRVVATDTAGSVTSSVASLSVVPSILVNVQYRGLDGETYQAGFSSTTYSGAAVLGSAGDAWNAQQVHYYSAGGGNIITGASLVNSANSASALTLTLGYVDIVQGGSYSGTATDVATTNLMGSAVSIYNYAGGGAGNTTTTHTIAGLSSYSGYPAQLVVYAAAKNARTENINITGGASGGNSGSTLTTSSTSRQISAGVGVAYQVFTNLTLSSSNLVFTVSEPGASGAQDSGFVNGFQLQINDPYVVIASQPVSVTNASGSTVSFSVGASGAALSYQWQTNGVNVGNGGIFSGATSSTLTVTGATSSSPVNYQVVVSNSFSGSVTSSVASLSLTPNITTQPLALQATTVGGNTSLSVVADGSPTVTYQWQATNSATGGFTNLADGAIFTGSATSTLNITGATAAQVLTYQVVVANSFGSVTSTPSVLTVSSSPVVTIQPLSQTNNAGATVNFSVTATGTAPLAYQWQAANGVGGYTNVPNVSPVSGATTSTLTIAGIADANALSYQVVITNASGSTTSSVATLTVIDPPVIASSPASQSVLVGATVNFTVTTSSGTAPFSYQWQTNGVSVGNNAIVSGATSSTLTLTGVTTNYALNYTVVVSNPAGSVTSSPAATLTVHVPASIVTQPVSTNNVLGTTASFNVVAVGDPTLAYQWQVTNSATGGFTNLLNGGQISGANINVLTIANLSSNWGSSYRVIVTNSYGAVTSSVASLGVLAGTTSLYIINNSFESPYSGGQQIYDYATPGTYSFVTGWTTVDTSGGYWNLNTGANIAGETNVDGVQLLEDYSPGAGGGGGYIYQELTNTWVPGAVYTMTARAGYPGGNPPHTGDTVSIDANNGGTLTQLSSATISNVKGGLYNYTVTYTATGSEAGDGHPVVAFHAPSQASNGGMWVDDYAITMSTAALITSQPASVTNVAGTANSFAVTAQGATLSYQWQASNGVGGYTNLLNGGGFSGATSNVLSIASATGSTPGSYQLVISNYFGSVTSSVATLSLTPNITTQPAALTALLVGGSGSLNVVADGSPTVTYQWQATNSATGGFTNLTDVGAFTGSATPTLNITSASTAQSLTYQVVVANGFGSVTSTPSVLTVSSSPVVTVQPLSQTNNAGATVNFSVTATGTAPLAYQWQATNNTTGFTNIPAATSSTLTIAGIADANALSYQVVITNASGSTTSSVATLTVIDAPVIASSPASQSVNVGATVNFTVTTSSGTAPFSYQWQTNGVSVGNNAIVSGATSSTLTLTGVTTNYALNYTVVVSNPAGSVTSSPAAALTVHIPPSIVTQPSSPVVAPGATATFSVVAAGDPTLAYQWQSGPAGGPFTNVVNGGQYSGATSSTLTVTNANTPAAISYQVTVNSSYGSVTSSVVSLTLGKLINVDIGSTANVQTGAAVLGAAGDVWNGVTGSQGGIVDSASNVLSGVSFADSSYFGFNSGGSTAMDAATTPLMVDCVFGFVGNSPSSFPVSLSGLSAYNGDTFTLVVYSGVGDPGQGANLTLAGATGGNTATTLGVSADTRQISAGIGHAYNTFTGTLASGTLTITASPNVNPTFFGINGFQLLINLPDPAITTNPVSQTKVSGSTATFSVAATGSATLSYQWQATNSASGGFTNLTDIPGVISGSQSNLLTFTGVTASESLTYQVVVSNGSGSVTSTPASLNVLTIPVINTQPASQTVLSGSPVTFNVSATGIGTLTYQWQTNGVNVTDGGIISGSATSTLTLSSVTTNNAVSYQVIITNANGSVTSTVASLTVLPTTELINGDIGPGGLQTGAAILGASGDVWNDLTGPGTFSTVIDSASNTLSGVSATVTGGSAYNSGNAPVMDAATINLMQDFVYQGPGGPSVPVTISGLGLYTNSAFTLVVYAAGDGTSQAQTINITSGATGGNTASTLATTSATRKLSDGIGVAYNVFTGTLTNGTLTFTVSGASYHGPNGFQLLVSPTVPPVITSNPVSTTNYTGTTATFSVGAVTATGSLSYQWQANGTNLTDGGIVSGSATSTLTLTGVTTNSALPYQVIVSNGGGSVTSSVANLTVFTVPVAGPNFTLGVTLGVPATVQIVGGKYTPTDANGFPLTITSVTGQTNGIVSTDGTNITYTATNTAASATNDSFTYTVSDGYSGTASQTVSVAINTSSAAAKGFNMISQPQMIGGYEVLTYAGIPGFNYALDWTTNLTPPIVWTPIMTNPASANGSLILSNTPSAGPDFYRTRYVP